MRWGGVTSVQNIRALHIWKQLPARWDTMTVWGILSTPIIIGICVRHLVRKVDSDASSTSLQLNQTPSPTRAPFPWQRWLRVSVGQEINKKPYPDHWDRGCVRLSSEIHLAGFILWSWWTTTTISFRLEGAAGPTRNSKPGNGATCGRG